MTKYVKLGKIVNTHGIRGELRIQSITSKPEERYTKGNVVLIETQPNSYEEFIINSHRVHKSFDLLTFDGYTNINEVEHFKGKFILINEADLPELKEHEYYIDDIIGFNVIDQEDKIVGKLRDVLAYPAHDIWVVKRQNKKDLLLPNITSVILGIDYDEKHINVHILEGLDTDEN